MTGWPAHSRPPGRFLFGLALSFAGAFVWSAIGPTNRFVWFLEVVPAIAALVILVATFGRFPLSRLAYVAIWLHALVLCIGGHYTYAEVPLFNILSEVLSLGRNHYDRVGHFAQGFFPAVIIREILVHTSPLRPGKWLFFIVASICLAFSAFYELIEWWVALATGEAADAFLGSQGDVWDTQWDMALCLLGTIVSQLLLARWHDRMLALGLSSSDQTET